MDNVTAPPPLVQIRSLSKAFSGVHALANVHFDLHAGEVHALMGENGAGMVMVMTTDDAIYDGERMAQATATDPVIARWEALMWTYQAPAPGASAGQKWIPMSCIFDWRAPGGS